MDKSNNKLFIHSDMEPVTLEHSVEIILTPQFYTFIRENLDVKFSYQAKQIAASLFDDYLNTMIDYQYHVNKCDGEWCFFAYNIDEIDYFLESKGIEKHRVSKIYFAQQLDKELTKPVQLSAKNALQTIDGTVTIIPTRLLEPDTVFQTFDLEDAKLSSGITMGASLNSFISLKETILLSSLFFILGAVSITEGSRIKSSIGSENEKLTQLFNDHKSYRNSSARKNILNTYQKIDNDEHAKRQSIKEISKLLSAKSQLLALKIEKNKISATIKTSDTGISKQVSRNAKAKDFKSFSNGLDVKVEKQL